jgi:hypothetical protein
MAKSINRKFGQFAKYVESDGDVKFIAGGNILITNANGVVTIAYDGAPALPSGQSLLYNDSLPTNAITGSLSFSSALNSIHFKSDDSWFRLAIFGQDSIGNILAQLDSVILVIPSEWAVFNTSLQAWKGDYELVASLEGNSGQGLGNDLVGYSRNIVSGSHGTYVDSSRSSLYVTNWTISNIENASIAPNNNSNHPVVDGQLGDSPFNDNLVYTTSSNSNRGNTFGTKGILAIPEISSTAPDRDRPEIVVYNGNSKIEIFRRSIGSSNWTLNRTKDEPGGYVEDNGFGVAMVNLYSTICAISAPAADNPVTTGGGIIYTYNIAGTGTSFYQKLYPDISCYALAAEPNWLSYSGIYGRATSKNYTDLRGEKIGRHLAALDLNYRIYTWSQPDSIASQNLWNAWTYTGVNYSNADGKNVNFRTIDVNGDTLVGAGFVNPSATQPSLKVFKWNDSTSTFNYSQFLYYEDSHAPAAIYPSSLLVDSDEGTIFVGYKTALDSDGSRCGAVLVYQRDSSNGLFAYKNSIRADDPLSYSFGASIMKPNTMQHAIIIGDPDYRLNSGKVYLYTSKSGVIQYGTDVYNDGTNIREANEIENVPFVQGVLDNITYSNRYVLPTNTRASTYGGMEFNDSGTKLVFGQQSGGFKFNTFSLSTAWDLSTLSHDSDLTFSSSNEQSFTFGNNGNKLYVIGTNFVRGHTLTTAYDPMTYNNPSDGALVYPDDFETSPNGNVNFKSIQFSNDGYRFYLLDDYDNNSVAGQPGIWTGKLTIPWDVTSLDSDIRYGREFFDWSDHGTAARTTADVGNIVNGLAIVKNQKGFGSAAFAAFARGLDSTADDGLVFGGQANGNYFSTRHITAPDTSSGSARFVTWSYDNRKLYQSDGRIVWEFDVSI